MRLSSWLLGLVVGLVIGIGISITTDFEPKNIILQKSSDSEWEVSTVSMPDTTITDTATVGGIEVHPTTQYLNVKL